MKSEQKNPSTMRDHEMKNEGGRESGRVHEPSQTQQASRKQGLADDMRERERQQGQNAPGHQQSGSGTHQSSSPERGKPPGSSPPSSTHDRKKDHQSERRSA